MFTEERTEFKFEWSHLGDVELGRPNLGNLTTVAMYRLMQFTLRDSCILHTNPATTTKIFYDAGHTAGQAVFENLLKKPESLDELVSRLQKLLKDLRVGILRVEEVDSEAMILTLTVDEDLDCSGLPPTGEVICTFDEGLIAGIFEAFTGRRFDVKEIDCWSTGERTCRFRAVAVALTGLGGRVSL